MYGTLYFILHLMNWWDLKYTFSVIKEVVDQELIHFILPAHAACFFIISVAFLCLLHVAELNKLLNSEFEAFIEDLKLSAVTSDFDDDIEPKGLLWPLTKEVLWGMWSSPPSCHHTWMRYCESRTNVKITWYYYRHTDTMMFSFMFWFHIPTKVMFIHLYAQVLYLVDTIITALVYKLCTSETSLAQIR